MPSASRLDSSLVPLCLTPRKGKGRRRPFAAGSKADSKDSVPSFRIGIKRLGKSFLDKRGALRFGSTGQLRENLQFADTIPQR